MNANRQEKDVAGVGNPGFGGRRLFASRAFRLLCICAWLFLASSTIFADTHYVDVNSPNPLAPYTSWETAAKSIHDAVDAAGNGDTVLVGAGTYNIKSTIVISKGLTVRSVNGPETTIIDANRNCRVFKLNSGNGPVTMEGFTVTGGYIDSGGAHGGGIVAGGSDSTKISNCIVEGNEAGTCGGINVSAGKGRTILATIENCIVRNNRSNGHCGGINATMWENATGSIVFENCAVYGNRAAYQGGGILNHNPDTAKNVRVVNCTITGNFSQTSCGGVKNVDAYNSIIYDNSAIDYGSSDVGGTGCRVSNSCSSLPSSSNTGNIRKKPKFVNAKGGDFRLMPDSPCIDAGSNLHSTQSTDLDGNPRIMGINRDGDSVVDMGAYEFQVIHVEIDIKPASGNKSINLTVGGLLPVAILSSEIFDASKVDPSSIRFVDTKPVRHMLQDVDEDGDIDLLLEFKRKALELDSDITKATLIGQTRNNQPFVGSDVVEILPAR